MKKFNVVRKKTFTKNNIEKVVWLQVGMITEFDNGNRILELNDRNETYNIFPLERKEGGLTKTSEEERFIKTPDGKIDVVQNLNKEYGKEYGDDIDVSSIPF